MELTQGSQLHNFTVTAIRSIPEKDAELIQMVYEKTGTELVWVRSQESNKLFGIAFKTIPQDDTGVFHILEHSVLCGSEKYGVKEPFVELLKSSMNTFLNAMTFPDKTLYPISSRNDQDFLNLTGVYLDAVFAPNILRNPNIFRQEGWHYELNDQELTYNGVVFNEMKGAMSSVDEVAFQGIAKLLFPDNCYQYNSGGDPAAIPNLTEAQFVETYKKNYHPTNARIFLDGNIPVEQTFAMLDDYLSRFEMGEKQILLPQSPVSREDTVYYEAVKDGTPKAQLLWGKILGTYEDKTTLLARQILCDVLCGSNDALLKRPLLDTGLCQDMTLSISDGIMQPYMVLRLHNMNISDIVQLEDVIRTQVKSLLENGIPKDRLTASINQFSFRRRQMPEPQGLIRCMCALESWLYDGDPMLYLHYSDSISEIRTMAENGGFEPLLEEMLLSEDGLCRLHVLPSDSHGTQLRQAEQDRLRRAYDTFNQDELNQIRSTFETFSRWQQTPDTPEALASIPKLSLDEINAEPMRFNTTEETVNGVTLIRHKTDCNGVIYLNGYFRLTDIPLTDLPRINLLSVLLSNLSAGGLDSATLQNEIKTYLGRLSFWLDVQGKTSDPATCTPMLKFHCRVLEENLPKAEALIHTILTATDFRSKERILQLVNQENNDIKQYCAESGHMLALTIARAHADATGAVNEAYSGITYVHSLRDLCKDFDSQFDGFATLMEQTMKKAVCRSRMILSITEDGHSDVSSLIARFPEGTAVPASVPYTTSLPKKVGVRIPAQVSFASVSLSARDTGIFWDGTSTLISNILSLAHLWNEIRVQGGAYGAGMRIDRMGTLFTYTFRDPAPDRSLKVKRNMGDFLRSFCASGHDITGYIIRAVSESEPLISAAEYGNLADKLWFSGITHQHHLAERQDLLNATAATLDRWCVALDAIGEKASMCVVGYAEALDACKDEHLEIFAI